MAGQARTPAGRGSRRTSLLLAPCVRGLLPSSLVRLRRRRTRAPWPGPRRQPAHWTRIDRDYENLRTGMQTLFHDLGITVSAAAAA